MAKTTTWLLVADSSRARLFSANGGTNGLETLSDNFCGEAREKAKDRGSDRPGRVQESANSAHHAVEAPTDPKTHEIQRFVQDIAGQVSRDAIANKFDRLIVAAPPQVLGYYRQYLGEQAKARIVAEVPKSFTQLKEHQILERVKSGTDIWLGNP